MFGLFEWETYEECGGWNDHVGTFGTVDSARHHMNRDVTHLDDDRPATVAQIVDLVTGTIIEQWERRMAYAGRGQGAPENWTYPEDEGGRIYWEVEPWEKAT